MGVCGGRGVCVIVCVRADAVYVVVPWFVVVSPSFRCACDFLSSSAACCDVVPAVVPWLVAVLPTLVTCATGAVYRVVLFLSLWARLSSLPLPCGLLFAFGGPPRVVAAYPFLYPCLLGPALLPCAHFALSCSCVLLPFLVPLRFRGPAGQRMGVQGKGVAVRRDV